MQYPCCPGNPRDPCSRFAAQSWVGGSDTSERGGSVSLPNAKNPAVPACSRSPDLSALTQVRWQTPVPRHPDRARSSGDRNLQEETMRISMMVATALLLSAGAGVASASPTLDTPFLVTSAVQTAT